MPASYRRTRRKINPNFVNVFRQSALRATAREMRIIAEELRATIVEVIRMQDFNLQPLSPAYARFKERAGLDPRILIATGDYVGHIQIIRDESREHGVAYSVGFPEGAIHEPSGLTYHVLARVHEFGSAAAHVPPRPHWRPVWSRFVVNLQKIRRGLVHAVVQEFRRTNR